jgi:hypothetical protein
MAHKSYLGYKIQFLIDPKIKKISGKLFYIPNDHAFDFEPLQVIDITLVFDYLQLEFDSDSKLAKQIWGFNPYEGWINKKLTVPQICEGGLLIKNQQDIEFAIEAPGVGITIIGHNQWNTYYDKDSGWICFGDFNTSKTDSAVEFANGIVAVVAHNMSKTLWFKPIFEQPIDTFVAQTE